MNHDDIRAAKIRAAEAAVIAGIHAELKTEEISHRWRVRWETPDGMYTFANIGRQSEPLTRSYVESWAAGQVSTYPDRYARVAACFPDPVES